MKLTTEDVSVIRAVLEQLHFYEHLREDDVLALIEGFEKEAVPKGDTLITQGKPGEIFYILASGSVGIYLKGQLLDKQIATLGANSFFGEMSLVSEEVRSASVVTEEDSVVYTLLRSTFDKVIMANPDLAEMIRKTAHQRKNDTRDVEYKEWMGGQMK